MQSYLSYIKGCLRHACIVTVGQALRTMVRVAVQRLDARQWAAIQSEGLVSRGRGFQDITIFRRKRRGGGVGSFLGNILKTYGPKILPFLRNYILPTAKSMGKDVLNDVVKGKTTLKRSLKRRGLESVGKIATEVASRGGGGKRVRRRTARQRRGCHPRLSGSVRKARGGGRRGGRVHKKPGGRGRRKTLAKKRVKKRKRVPKPQGIKDIFSI